MNIFQALRAWLDPSEAVVPETELFPAGQSAQQTQAQDTEEMAGSQELATAAALTELHIPYQTLVSVVSTVPGYPGQQGAEGRGRHRDGGRQAGDGPDVAELDDHGASGGHGAHARRCCEAGKTLTIPVASKASGGTPVDRRRRSQEQYKFPFNGVDQRGQHRRPERRDDVRARDHRQAHPGQPDRREVHRRDRRDHRRRARSQPIGGIQQKMVGARVAGATDLPHPGRATARTRPARCPPGCGW